MRVLVAPQEFKGTLTGGEAALAIARGIRAARSEWEVEVAPLADGGPGTLEALIRARGGERRAATVEDPLGRPVEAEWAILPDGTAVVEMAQASGLWRVAPFERDVLRASTYGTGQLVRCALEAGCARVLVGAGGSATNDAGAGALEALGLRFLDAAGAPLPRGGAALARLDRIDLSLRHPMLERADLRVATDVTNPLLGPLGVTHVFAAQKGADEQAREVLEGALAHFARAVALQTGFDGAALPGTAAAGGLAYGLVALAGARIVGGFDEIAGALELPARIARADVVVTGEGRLDSQTLHGKGPGAVAARARAMGRRAICFAGSVEGGRDLFDEVIEVSPGAVPRSREAAEAILERAARAWAARAWA